MIPLLAHLTLRIPPIACIRSKIKSENYGENSMRNDWQMKNRETDHVDVNRPLKQLPLLVWERLLIPIYVPLCNISSKRMNTERMSDVRRSR